VPRYAQRQHLGNGNTVARWTKAWCRQKTTESTQSIQGLGLGLQIAPQMLTNAIGTVS
jgi:hypothetical protein